jgi:hypothetical protein
MPYGLWISAFGLLKIYFENEPIAWMKQNPQRKIARYHVVRYIGFAWNKAASMGVDISAVGDGYLSFEPQQIS